MHLYEGSCKKQAEGYRECFHGAISYGLWQLSSRTFTVLVSDSREFVWLWRMCQFTTYSFYSWAELDRSDTGLKYWYFKLEGDTDLTDDTGK